MAQATITVNSYYNQLQDMVRCWNVFSAKLSFTEADLRPFYSLAD